MIAIQWLEKGLRVDPNTVTIGAAVAMFAALFGFWWKLDSKMDRMDSKTDRMDSKMDRMDSKLTGRVDSLDSKLTGEVKEVRQASETAHNKIIGRLGGIETTQATHTERFNTIGARIDCIEDKIDNIIT